MRIFTVGLLLLLAPAIIYADSDTCFELNLDADVLVLGGGITGVSAARTLQENGINDFLIIEALPQLGGRIRTVELRPGSGIMINPGANWIQGYDPLQPGLHPLIQIVNTTRCGGIEGSLSDFDSLVVRNSRGMDISESSSLRYDDYTAVDDAALSISETRRAAGQSDITVREALRQGGWTPVTAEDEWVEWYQFDFCFAEPTDNSSLFEAFPLATFLDFGDPERTGDFFITDNEGFFKVMRCLAEDFLVENDPRVHLNTRVTRIEWSDDCVCVTADENGSTRRLCAKYGIVTFSVGVLQDLETAGIVFDPPLPEDKVNAINQFRMTHYLNVVVDFNSRFWESDVQFIGHVNETNGRYFSLFQLLSHLVSANALLITLTDTLADRIVRQTQEQNKQEIIDIFNNAYNLTLQPSDIRTLSYPDWDINPLFLGSYSNNPIGVTDVTFADFRKPLGNRLYFGGEVASRKYSGYAHGGYLNGIDTAEALVAEMQRANSERGMLVQATNWFLLTTAALFVGLFSISD